jgi:hypothetical protein
MEGLAQSYQLIATLLFILVSLVVALRLLALSYRTRCTPELYLGLGLLGTAVLGYGGYIAASLVRITSGSNEITTTIRVLQAAGEVFHDSGVTMILVFVVSVFRPTERWAKYLLAALLLMLWGGDIGWELENGFQDPGPGNLFWWLRHAVVWTYPLWMMFESYRYYGSMRRRLALGLADPLVTNRFFLWGSASVGTALATWTSSSTLFLAREAPLVVARAPAAIEIATATFGMATVALYYLTFFAPAWYRRWVEGGAPAPLKQR